MMSWRTNVGGPGPCGCYEWNYVGYIAQIYAASETVKAAKQKPPDPNQPVQAPEAEYADKGSTADFFGLSRRRRTIQSTEQGGQSKRLNTLLGGNQ